MLSFEEDLTAVDRVDTGDAFDEGRFAGAVVSDECHHFAVAHLEIGLAKGLDRAEVLRNPAQLECRGRGRVHRRVLPRWRRSWERLHREGLPSCRTSCT